MTDASPPSWPSLLVPTGPEGRQAHQEVAVRRHGGEVRRPSGEARVRARPGDAAANEREGALRFSSWLERDTKVNRPLNPRALNRNAHGDGRNKTLLRSPLQTRTPRPPQARVLASSWCSLGCCANLTSSLQRMRRNRCLFGTTFPGPCVCHLATGMTRSPTRWCLSMRRSASRSRCSTAG